ncbi:MAG: endolytic transglycosylase MltG [Flavobacteriales bacterium]|jgi:UPF0755 protein|nr:endolytic transglycosylase MltG [Flavobacteriales bacterium]
MKKILALLIVVLLVIGGIIAYPYYQVYQVKDIDNIAFDESSKNIMLSEPILFSELGTFLKQRNIIKDQDAFDLIVDFKHYDTIRLNEGMITIKKDWNNNKLVNQLYLMRNQKKIITLTFGSARNLEELAGKIAPSLALDSVTLVTAFKNEAIQSKYGFNHATFISLFLPNTYEVYYNITADEFIAKMAKEYKKFWNAERLSKAKALKMSQSEITTLASIVYEEQKVKFDEQPKIAGLYLNRLKNNWLLQADPTVKFALGDPSIKRLLFKHLEVESPYNTYRNAGLPPGPICLPEPRTIDAVLNFEKHQYFYMCAKPEYSGYHNFSKTLSQHNAYAKEYQSWLTKEGIR